MVGVYTPTIWSTISEHFSLPLRFRSRCKNKRTFFLCRCPPMKAEGASVWVWFLSLMFTGYIGVMSLLKFKLSEPFHVCSNLMPVSTVRQLQARAAGDKPEIAGDWMIGVRSVYRVSCGRALMEVYIIVAVSHSLKTSRRVRDFGDRMSRECFWQQA